MERHRGFSAAVIVGWAITVGVGAYGATLMVNETHEVHALHHAVTTQDQNINTLADANSALTNRVNNINTKIGGLIVPSDPLAAYNTVCNQQLDDEAGNYITYYFPCTPNASTIPEPSG